MYDSLYFKEQRERLCRSLLRKGITNNKVLNAINNVPRHMFMQTHLQSKSYQDNAFPIEKNQTISQPYTVAFQTQLLDINKGDKVLEIGTGSGYQTAVLVEAGAEVFSVERIQQLHDKAKKTLDELNYKANLFFGDGNNGLPEFMPFDKILITAATPVIPEKLLHQLSDGGILVAPVGDKKMQKMITVVKTDNNSFEKKEHGSFIFGIIDKMVAVFHTIVSNRQNGCYLLVAFEVKP